MHLCHIWKDLFNSGLYLPLFCIAIISKYRVHNVYLIKMKILTDISYKEHWELYTEIHDMSDRACKKRRNTIIRYSCDTL